MHAASSKLITVANVQPLIDRMAGERLCR